tara:strand:- start:221868 stop:224441 length:2574 start_codon:yes stop_codon:yes gene_type:complete
MNTPELKSMFQIGQRSTQGLMLALALCSGSVAGVATAAPEGGDVVEGDAKIDYGDWTRVITGEITIIQWLSFQIAAGETVEFIMPSENSRVLNLINSGVPTEIMGTILGNGQVFLVNPSGVIFGQGAVVNVGALYAAAGNISNNDFMDGVYRFTDARGVVENRGMLQGDLIALVGGRVANHGTISAPGGTVVMAAGEQVLIGEHLGHVFVQLERPSDLANTDQLSNPGKDSGVDLAAGDVFSLAAWNTGTIQAEHATIAVSSGHSAIDHSIEAGDITLIAQNDAHIELGADLSTTGDGIFIEGDLVITDDVELTSSSDDGVIFFKGEVDSAAGQENDLRINAGNGLVSFRGSVGQTDRLGVLDVTAGKVQLFGDVAVNEEMNFYAPVEIMRASTTFDVGFGTALFADLLYAHEAGASDVAFLYDGEAWVGEGEARTPFKFRSGIGFGPQFTSGRPIPGAFGNIQFGDDRATPSRVSAFMFADGAMAGLELMDSANVNLDTIFQVNARESIRMGRGQKMLSFGSLSLLAKGEGASLIEVGDVNVLGDLRIIAIGRQGGMVRFLNRAPGEIDYTGNESDRELDGLFDEGTELIASGSITLGGELVMDGGVSLGASQVQFLNNTGAGNAGAFDIALYPGGVSIDLFRGVLNETTGLLYPYDLTLPPTAGGGSQALLATSFTDEEQLNLRTDDRLLASRAVLAELGLIAQDPQGVSYISGTTRGGARYQDGAVSTQATDGQSVRPVTIDRLSRRSVARLASSYVGLLGERVDADSPQRSNESEVRETIQSLWASNVQSAAEDSPVVRQVRGVLQGIELLELSPVEISTARNSFLNRIAPEGMSAEVLDAWLVESVPRIVKR